MRILLVHAHYLHAGGEDQVFAAEGDMLERAGHEVVTYTSHNDALQGANRVALAARAVWNPAAYADLNGVCRRVRPDVVHFHNTFPGMSPAAYHAAARAGVPVIQTLHNYRLLCPGIFLLRDGRPCEDCVGKRIPFPAIRHGCYRGDRAATGAVATMLAVHRTLGTWSRQVDTYIALTEAAKSKFIAGGLPADRIVVKPNFVSSDPGVGTHRGGYALFVGRLAPEKGVHTLLDAWERIGGGMPLRIAGAGPLEALDTRPREGVEWLGGRDRERVFALMKDAAFLIMPSEWYETFGLTIIEAFATGLPVIASRMGAMAELVEDGATGLHFTAGDAADLADRVQWALAHPAEMAAMGSNARKEYCDKYTAEANYMLLADIYQRTIQRAHDRKPAA